MDYEKRYVYCPLMEQTIDDGICFDICLVAEHMAPAWSAPKKAVAVDDFESICMKCEFHPE